MKETILIRVWNPTEQTGHMLIDVKTSRVGTAGVTVFMSPQTHYQRKKLTMCMALDIQYH